MKKECQRIREKLRRKGYTEGEIKFRLRKKSRKTQDAAKYVLEEVVENERLEDVGFGRIAFWINQRLTMF